MCVCVMLPLCMRGRQCPGAQRHRRHVAAFAGAGAPCASCEPKSNTLDEAPRVARALRARFPALVRIEVNDYDNRILAAGPAGLDARLLRARVAAHPVLSASLDTLHFRTWTRPA